MSDPTITFIEMEMPPLDQEFLALKAKIDERLFHWLGFCAGRLPKKRCPLGLS